MPTMRAEQRKISRRILNLRDPLRYTAKAVCEWLSNR